MRRIAVLLVFVLPSFLSAQPPSARPQWSPVSSVGRIQQLTEELDQNLSLQAELIEKLQTGNGELLTELNEALSLLKESEASLRKQIALSENLGNLIEDQAIYQRQLERKLTFWRIISGVLATSLATTLIVTAVNK